MNQNEPMDKAAKEIGIALEQSEEFKQLDEATKIQNNDDEAQRLIGEYNLVRLQLMQKMQGKDMTDEQLNQIRMQLADEFDKLMQYEIIKNYIDAKEKFDNLYNKVKNVIDFYASGEKSGGCSGSCSTCGGCH